MIRSRAADKSSSPLTTDLIVRYPLDFHAGASSGIAASSARASPSHPASIMCCTRVSIRDDSELFGSTRRYEGEYDDVDESAAWSALILKPVSNAISIARTS